MILIWRPSYCLQITRSIHTRLLLMAIINIRCRFLNTPNTIVLKTINLHVHQWKFKSRNSVLKHLLENLCISQENNVNWASSKLASAWALLSFYKVLAIQVWLICWRLLFLQVLLLGSCRRAAWKPSAEHMPPAGRSLPTSELDHTITWFMWMCASTILFSAIPSEVSLEITGGDL